MSDEQQMECPECGEGAVHQASTDQVPWQAHGITPPEWSHKDGSSLCPVLGSSGGYRPAEPQPRRTEPEVNTARLDPPATVRPASPTEPTDSRAEARSERNNQRLLRLPAGTAGVFGRRYMAAQIARLRDLPRQVQAHQTEPEHEAGA